MLVEDAEADESLAATTLRLPATQDSVCTIRTERIKAAPVKIFAPLKRTDLHIL